MKEHTNEEWVKHSEDLEKDESYGKGPVDGYEINLAFKDTGTGMKAWHEGTDFFRSRLESMGWDNHSSGTGFGERDMQFERATPLTKEEFDQVVEDAKTKGITLVRMSQCGANEWGEPCQDDTPHDFGYDAE